MNYIHEFKVLSVLNENFTSSVLVEHVLNFGVISICRRQQMVYQETCRIIQSRQEMEAETDAHAGGTASGQSVYIIQNTRQRLRSGHQQRR